MENLLNKDTAFLLLMVLLIGMLIGAKMMFSLTRNMRSGHWLFGQQPQYPPPYTPYQIPYQSPANHEGHSHHPNNRESSGGSVLLALLVWGVIAFFLYQQIKDQKQTRSDLTQSELKTNPKSFPELSKRTDAPLEPLSYFAASTTKTKRAPLFVEDEEIGKKQKTYLIRAGTFLNVDLAEKEIDRLKALHAPVGYFWANWNGEKSCVVVLGAYEAMDIAKYHRQQFKLEDCRIIPALGLDVIWQ